MRETKFRGKRADTGEWVYGNYFVSPLTDENSGTPPSSGWFFLSGDSKHCIEQNHVVFVIDPETLGEFTGILDQTHKEIYEGDFILADDHGEYFPEKYIETADEFVPIGIYMVVWDYNTAGWGFQCPDGTPPDIDLVPFSIDAEFTVKGNKFDTAELCR